MSTSDGSERMAIAELYGVLTGSDVDALLPFFFITFASVGSEGSREQHHLTC